MAEKYMSLLSHGRKEGVCNENSIPENVELCCEGDKYICSVQCDRYGKWRKAMKRKF